MYPTNKPIYQNYFTEPIPGHERESHLIPANTFVFKQHGQVLVHHKGSAPLVTADRFASLSRVNELMFERQMERLENTEVQYDYHNGTEITIPVDIEFQMHETPFEKAFWPFGVIKTSPVPEQELDDYMSDIRQATLALRGQIRCGNVFGPETKGNMFLFFVKKMIDVTCYEPEFLRRMRNTSSKRLRLGNELSQYIPIWQTVISPSMECPIHERMYQVPVMENGKFKKNSTLGGYEMQQPKLGPAVMIGISKYTMLNDMVDQLYSYPANHTDEDPETFGHIELLLTCM